MNQAELAAQLVLADDGQRAAVLVQHCALADVDLAWELKAIYDAAESSAPARAERAATALNVLARTLDTPDVQAIAAWVTGMADLDHGRLEDGLAALTDATAGFVALEQPHIAAAVCVSKLIALAMLGRYDEAIDCGQRARDTFLAHGDLLAAGKIEQNLGNIYHRREQYAEAEQCYRAARARFLAVGNQKLLAAAENGLANVLALQHQFRAADALYEQALQRAEADDLDVLRALLECNLGCLALFQGRYDRALAYLEQARRRYAALDMPHLVASTELELAEVYLELNLTAEAAAIYERIIPTFAELGMRAEQARALTQHGQACLLLGQMVAAQSLLAEADALYNAEGNRVGQAMVALAAAHVHYLEGEYTASQALAAQAEAQLAAVGTQGRRLLARWLRAEALRALGQFAEAQALLATALDDAERQEVPQIAQHCLTSLGLIAAASGQPVQAEAAFTRAVAIVEALRAPLPGDEFRVAFIADKLTPFTELVRLCLADERANRVPDALGYVERARARALVDLLGGKASLVPHPRDAFEAELVAQLEQVRTELNWYYSQINSLPNRQSAQRPDVMTALNTAVYEREAAVTEITRQLQQRAVRPASNGLTPPYAAPFDQAALQQALGVETALVEFFSLDDELLAFVVTDDAVEIVRGLGHEEPIARLVRQLRFQIDALRHNRQLMERHVDQLTTRVQHYLARLYAALLRPIEPHVGARRLVIVPHGVLYYVPFHALYDGARYVVEQREVSYAPSAQALQHTLVQPQRPLKRAVLLGVDDDNGMPAVRDELRALAPLFPEAVVLHDDAATLAALRAHAPHADALHLACHGRFRPDNPLFSSLRLADGLLTVRDALDLDLNQALVVLSACETGIHGIAPGDELLGLVRGFFAAGAPTLLVSLWAVDDRTTAALMADFYTHLRAGARPAQALRQAQCAMLEQHAHPFFWSPFALFGRW